MSYCMSCIIFEDVYFACHIAYIWIYLLHIDCMSYCIYLNIFILYIWIYLFCMSYCIYLNIFIAYWLHVILYIFEYIYTIYLNILILHVILHVIWHVMHCTSYCMSLFHLYIWIKIIGLFCKRALQQRKYSAKET